MADLGLDKVMVYGFDPADGTLKSNDPPWGPAEPGVGPRHLAFHPDGDRVYVLNEMAASLTVYQYDPATGALDARQTVDHAARRAMKAGDLRPKWWSIRMDDLSMRRTAAMTRSRSTRWIRATAP